MLTKIGLVFLLLAGCSLLSAGTIDLALDPVDGHLAGAPGTHVGWGFTITNGTPLWLFFTGSTLDFQTNSSIGTYTDFFQVNSGNDFSGGPGLVDPNTVWGPIGYDLGTQAGVADYLIDPSLANIGLNNIATITINYQSFDCNPTDSLCTPTEVDGSLTAAADILVQSAPSGVPEPSTALPLGVLALGWAGAWFRRRLVK